MVDEKKILSISTALGFPMYILQGTHAFILLEKYWPLLPALNSESLIEMVTLLNTQWLSEPSVQWLPFINCDWRRLLEKLLRIFIEEKEFLSETNSLALLVSFFRFTTLASRQLNLIKVAILSIFESLLGELVNIYLVIISSTTPSAIYLSIAEHILDLFCSFLSPISITKSKGQDLLSKWPLIPFSKCSVFWNQSEIFRQLVQTLSRALPLLKNPISKSQLQKAAFKILPLAIEPTDKKLLSSLAFGEYSELEKVSTNLLKELMNKVLITLPKENMPQSPSSSFLATLLTCNMENDPYDINPYYVDQTQLQSAFPTEKEIFASFEATTTATTTMISTCFYSPLLSNDNNNINSKIYIPVLEEYSTEYFKRAFLALRLDAGQEIRQELVDAACRLAPGPPRWARMGCWLATGSPSIIETPGNRRVGEIHAPWIKLSAEIILPAPLEVIGEWDSLRKGDLLFLIKIGTDGQLYAVQATEFQGFILSDGSVSTSRRKRIASENEGRRILLLQTDSSIEAFQNFNAIVRRDPKTAPYKHRLKALKANLNRPVNPTILRHFSSFLGQTEESEKNAPHKLQENILEYDTKIHDPLAGVYLSQEKAVKLAIDTLDRPVLILGSPGSGKTQVAAEIVATLYFQSIHDMEQKIREIVQNSSEIKNDYLELVEKEPQEKILLITHNNSTLDLLLERVLSILKSKPSVLDLKTENYFTKNISPYESNLFDILNHISPSHVIRLGSADPSSIGSGLSTSGLLTAIDQRRIDLLTLVDKLAAFVEGTTAIADHGASCESAQCFYVTGIEMELKKDPLIYKLFSELRHLRPLEVLHSPFERLRFLIKHEARIVAATISQALRAIDGEGDLPVDFTTLLIDEASLLLDSEVVLLASFFPNCRRIVLIGDHLTLPPILHSTVISEKVGGERSLLTNLIRGYEGGANRTIQPTSNTFINNTANIIPHSSTQCTSASLSTPPSVAIITGDKWRRAELSALFSWRYNPKIYTDNKSSSTCQKEQLPLSNNNIGYCLFF